MRLGKTRTRGHNAGPARMICALEGVFKTPTVSVAVDVLVILSLLLNFYSLYQSTRMGAELGKIDTSISTLNQTLEKTAADLSHHLDEPENASLQGAGCDAPADPTNARPR